MKGYGELEKNIPEEHRALIQYLRKQDNYAKRLKQRLPSSKDQRALELSQRERRSTQLIDLDAFQNEEEEGKDEENAMQEEQPKNVENDLLLRYDANVTFLL